MKYISGITPLNIAGDVALGAFVGPSGALAGNIATAGLRTNVRNINEKDAELAEQLGKGGWAGVSHFVGATTKEVTKMNLMVKLRTGKWSSDPPLKQALEGAVQAGGGTPDMYKERALGSWAGLDAWPKANMATFGVDTNSTQFEDSEFKGNSQ